MFHWLVYLLFIIHCWSAEAPLAFVLFSCLFDLHLVMGLQLICIPEMSPMYCGRKEKVLRLNKCNSCQLKDTETATVSRAAKRRSMVWWPHSSAPQSKLSICSNTCFHCFCQMTWVIWKVTITGLQHKSNKRNWLQNCLSLLCELLKMSILNRPYKMFYQSN